jgi:conjugative transposon TraK protein
MLNSLKNIQGAFSLSRFYLIGISLVSLTVSCYAVFKSYEYAEKQREKIYVLDDGKSLMLALAQDIHMNKPAEAKSHVRWFHELFFTLSPDASSIEDNVKQALFLADNSVLEFYKTRKENGYYQKMIGAGIINEIKVDSVIVDMEVYPYRAKTFASTSVMRTSSVTLYHFETKCQLVNCPRSDNNPHGFIIENWEVSKMEELSTIGR